MRKLFFTELLCGVLATAAWTGGGLRAEAQPVPSQTQTFVDRIAGGDHSWLDGGLAASYPGIVGNMNNTTITGNSLGIVPVQNAPRKAAIATTADGTEIWGLLISSDEWSSTSSTSVPYGVYQFNTADMATKALLGNVGYANGGGSFSENTLRYTAYGLEAKLVAYYYEYDINTWEVTEQPRTMDGHMISVCSAFDPTTYKTYAVYYGDDYDAASWNFGTIDYDLESTTKLSEITNICIAMACDNDGNLYGITVDGYLNKIDKQTGAFTKIGSTGLSVKTVMQSAVYDRDNDKFYWAAMTANNGAALYEVNLETGKATWVADFANREEPVAMFIPRQHNATAPAAATNLTLTFKGANTTGAVQFDAPSTTIAGKKLSGDLTYTVKANGKTIGEGDAEVGEEQVTVPVRNLEEGYTTFEVSLSGNGGAGEPAYIKKWIGRDVPQVPQNVAFTVDTDNNNFVTLTWDYPKTGGTHNGYADPSDFTYTVVRYPENTVVAEGITARTFTENVPQSKWCAHYYIVYAVNNGLKSEAAQSNIISFGDAVDLPYINTLTTKEDFGDFELFDRGDGYTWRFSQGITVSVASCKTSSTNPNDAWIVTPPMKMRKGYEYELDFQAYTNWYEDEKMGVYLCTGSDTTTFRNHVIDDVRVYNGSYTDRTQRNVRFSVDADGNYRVGFNCVSDPKSQAMAVDSISVREILCYEAPDSVRSLTVTPAADGAQEATIAFDAPTKRNNGNALTAIEKIEVIRDGEVFKTISNPTPGAHFSVTDEEAVNGFTTYEVVAYNEAGKGLAAAKRAYVGIDIPQKPTGVHLTDNFDGTVTLSWDKVTTGQNAQYIPEGEVTYNVYAIKNGNPTAIKTDLEETSITIDGIAQTGQQSRFYYGVQSQTEAGADGYTLSNTLLSGAPYTMPYYESFSNASQQNGPWTVSATGTGKLGMNNTTTQDGDRGAIVCYPSAVGYEGYLASPKISFSGSRHPVCTFYYYCTPGKSVGIDVYAVRNGTDTTYVKTFDFSQLSGEAGYRQGNVDLKEFKDDHYVQVLFDFFFNVTGTSILLDNIAIEDMKANDLKASIAIPVSVCNGQTSSATVTVENLGENAATDYTVKLYQNGNVVNSVTGEKLISGHKKEYSLDFTASKTSNTAIKLRAQVDFADDEDTDNNTTSTHTVFVYAPSYPTVSDLAANGQQLSWTAVSAKDMQKTEDFEAFYPLETKSLGDWTTVDNDGGTPYTFGLNYVEQLRNPSAYIVNNPAEIGYDLTSDPGWGAHEGNQYLLSLAVSPKTTADGHNDDWLISPLLSGKAQTVKAWVKSYNNTYGLENYEILYSTGGKQTSDFTSILTGEAPLEWTEVSAALPEGAKYFAIRHTSEDKYMFMLDDITYIPGGMNVTGYNVYRDGELIASLDANTTTYTDNDADNHIHDYVVTVVYEVGESGASNEVSTLFTAINALTAATTVSSGNGRIAIRGAKGQKVEIFNTAGMKMLSTTGEDNIDAATGTGVFVVKVGDKVFNITVGR